MRRPEQLLCEAAVGLGRGLRLAGLRTTVDAEMTFCRALGELELNRREHVYWAARATFVGSPEEIAAFDVVFERFWSGLTPFPAAAGVQHGESDPRMPGPQHGGDALPSFRLEGRSSTLVDGEPRRAAQEVPSAAGEQDERRGDRRRRGVLAAYSPDEVVDEPEELSYADEELAAMRRLGDDLRAAMPERPSRRLRPARRAGRLDLRRTVRRSLRTEGEALRPAWTAPSRTPRRLLLLCDVSGSMERFSRALLAALEGAVRSGLKVEAFVFATRLTWLTATLGGRDASVALERARAAVTDWSSGTRIGPALAEFNSVYARRGFARGAFVVVVSDGWDRGDPELLAREVERLRLGCRRLIWINPRPVEAHGQPLAVGMRAALPFVDDYLAGPQSEAVFQLGRLLGVLGSARPARPQRPVRLPAP